MLAPDAACLQRERPVNQSQVGGGARFRQAPEIRTPRETKGNDRSCTRQPVHAGARTECIWMWAWAARFTPRRRALAGEQRISSRESLALLLTPSSLSRKPLRRSGWMEQVPSDLQGADLSHTSTRRDIVPEFLFYFFYFFFRSSLDEYGCICRGSPPPTKNVSPLRDRVSGLKMNDG